MATRPNVQARPDYKTVSVNNISLSDYFPEGTVFYYGYPAGEDSGFLNSVTPVIEELVSARPLCCAGSSVSVVSFAAVYPQPANRQIYQDLQVPQLPKSRTVLLPPAISPDIMGKQRNQAIKRELKKLVKPGTFVMAQPYTDESMTDLYQIDPKITSWLNDKGNMAEYIPADFLPSRYGIYKNGAEFVKIYKNLKLPVVVKASSSSSGDGVHICLTKEDLDQAATKLNSLSGSILAEQYIKIRKNYGIHFGIPHDPTRPIDLLGINEQLVSPEGAFLGGIINSTDVPPVLYRAINHLMNSILPAVRKKGWYGIGGFDVLLDESGKTYFIDSNFRMTGMSAYHFLIANKRIKAPCISFSAEIDSDDILRRLATHNLQNTKFSLRVIALSKHSDTSRLNGVIYSDKSAGLIAGASEILELGVTSPALKAVSCF